MGSSRDKWNAGVYCVVCGSPYVQKHHVFFGSSRKAADKRGYIIPLCREHHTGDHGIHFDKDLDLMWKRMAQEHYERNFGTREEFIREFGRNYL